MTNISKYLTKNLLIIIFSNIFTDTNLKFEDMAKYYVIPEDSIKSMDIDEDEDLIFTVKGKRLNDFLREFDVEPKMPEWLQDHISEAKGIFKEVGSLSSVRFISDKARELGHPIALSYTKYLFDTFVVGSL